jgi:hypothetical protein
VGGQERSLWVKAGKCTIEDTGEELAAEWQCQFNGGFFLLDFPS